MQPYAPMVRLGSQSTSDYSCWPGLIVVCVCVFGCLGFDYHFMCQQNHLLFKREKNSYGVQPFLQDG